MDILAILTNGGSWFLLLFKAHYTLVPSSNFYTIMARQKGIIKLKGSIGDVSFYKTQDGYLAREKGGVDKERIKTDPAFQRTRENGAEFGRAGAAGRMLRTALRPLLLRTSDKRVTSRLTREMVKVVKADQVSVRGERNVLDGELELLQGFEFNSNGRLGATMYAPFQPSINRATGEAAVNIPDFIPQNTIAAPQGATHLKLVSAGAMVDFEEETFDLVTSESAEIVIGPQVEAAVNLLNALPAASESPLFLAFGVEFYQLVNGSFYPLKNGAYNALSLVAVDGGA